MSSAYPHLDGDLDANPRVLAALEKLAARRGELFHITSGQRSTAVQTQLWNGAPANGLIRGRTVAAPGSSLHEADIMGGDAADVTIKGRPIQTVVTADELHAVGLFPLLGDSVHVQLYVPGTSLEEAKKLDAGYKLDHGNGPLGVNAFGGPLAALGGPLDKAASAAGDALGNVLGKGVDSAASATANAVVDLFAGWAKTDGLRALLYVVLVGGGVVLATIGTSRALGARREVRA